MSHPCLYCKGTTPKTDEHVLQAAFGANIILTDEVCGLCNTDRFSTIDNALVRIVHRLFRSSRPGGPGAIALLTDADHLVFDDEDGLWLSVRVSREGHPILFPQLIFTEEGRATFICDSTPGKVPYERWREAFFGDLRNYESLALKTFVPHEPGIEGRPPVHTALIRSANNSFSIRARTQEEADLICSSVRRGTFAFNPGAVDSPSEKVTHQATLHSRYQVDFGAIHRAIAKVAINYCCHIEGAQAARVASLDEAKSDILSNAPLRENFGTQLLSDSSMDSDKLLAKLTQGDKHALLAVSAGSRVLITLSLYGQVLSYTAHPADAWPSLADGDFVATAFDHVSGTHETIDSHKGRWRLFELLRA